MLPIIVNIGPVSFTAFLVFSAAVLLVWFLVLKIFKPSTTARKDLVFYALFLIAGVLVLTIVGKVLPLRTYGVMVALGFVFGTLFALHEAKRTGIGQNLVMDLSIVALIGGIIGARLFYIVFYSWDYYMANPLKMFAVWEGGLVIYGGIIVAGLSLFFFLRKKSVNLKALFDIISLSLLIGMGFGRLGCLGFGCCYGKVIAAGSVLKGLGFLGLAYPKGSPAWADQLSQNLIGADATCSLPVWPTQIISSAGLFLMFLFLLLVHRKFKKFDGEIVSLFFVLYGVGRFLIELLRINPLYGPFSSAQWISLGMIVLGIFFLVRFGSSSKLKS